MCVSDALKKNVEVSGVKEVCEDEASNEWQLSMKQGQEIKKARWENTVIMMKQKLFAYISCNHMGMCMQE